jgi:hypothetical protein
MISQHQERKYGIPKYKGPYTVDSVNDDGTLRLSVPRKVTGQPTKRGTYRIPYRDWSPCRTMCGAKSPQYIQFLRNSYVPHIQHQQPLSGGECNTHPFLIPASGSLTGLSHDITHLFHKCTHQVMYDQVGTLEKRDIRRTVGTHLHNHNSRLRIRNNDSGNDQIQLQFRNTS